MFERFERLVKILCVGLAVLLASGDRLVLVAFKDDSDASGELDPEPEAERD